jgi:hypothetical protein
VRGLLRLALQHLERVMDKHTISEGMYE